VLDAAFEHDTSANLEVYTHELEHRQINVTGETTEFLGNLQT